MKKLLIVYSDYTPTIDAIAYQIKDIAELKVLKEDEYCRTNIDDYDFVISINCKNKIDNSISVYHSLQLDLNEENPVKKAILTGQKVTGITVYYTNNNKIISQYPVFITNETHYEYLVQELEYIEQILLPKVIEKIIKNEPFETQNLMQTASKFGGCQICKH